MPPAGAALRADRGGREVQQLGVVGDEDQLVVDSLVSSTAPTTWSPASSRMTSHASRAQHLRVDPLDHAARRTERQPERGLGPAWSGTAPARRAPAVTSSRHVRAALQVRRVGGRRHGGQVERVDPDQPAGAGDQPEIRPARCPCTAETITSWLARSPPAGSGSSPLVRASSPAEVSSTQHGSSVTSSGAAGGLGRRHAAGGQQDGAPRRAVAAWRPRPARRRPPSAAARVRPGSRSARRSSRCSSSRSVSSSMAGVLGQPAQRHVQDVVGLDLGQVEGLDQPGPGLRRRRRWTG